MALSLALGGAACTPAADTNTDTDTASDTSMADVGTADVFVGPDGVTRACVRQGFVGAVTQAEQLDSVVITSVTTLGSPYALLSIELRAGASAPGVYPLEARGLGACTTCVVAFADCNATGCAHTFVAAAGTLEITQLEPGLGGLVEGSLSNVRFDEVAFDASFEPIPVEDGETWCVDLFDFATTLAGETLPVIVCDGAPQPLWLAATSARYQPAGVYGPLLTVSGTTSAVEPWDSVSLELFTDAGAPTVPGTYGLSYENYADCGTCVRAGRTCSVAGCVDGEFLLIEGTLEITATGRAGDHFTATLRDARFFEHAFDADGGRSAPIIGGRSLCVDDVLFDAAIGL